MTNRLWILGLLFIIFSCQKAEQEVEIKWQELFNGKDIQDWQIKIRNHPLNENYANTFRVEDGNLSVRYDGYEDFGNQYGHIFYKEPFSYYLLQVEYRFIGDQAPGGEGWAYRNSGAMLHSQNPESMLQDQDFPISIEGQFLGGNGTDERSTCNLCTPGTNVVMGDTLFTPHCINSNSKTFHGDQWVQANFLVLGAEEIHHLVGKDTVLSYYQPQIGGGMVSPVDSLVKIDGKLLESGYIALQSESHPIDFRRVALIDLSMLKADKKAMAKLIKEALELSKIDPN
ncbi:3-keto-disaccharide hydrolase [Algoriphagus formosus]|uniref:DUF1080 domain-containing protein n=1 Tax=Algoriphagus formosus TaxID=2007308 RepID=A0A4V3AQ97_9BACT|nr:DUF1080 domain-containing protein [Algoriphagus aquimaris]TDK41887.1 DUF1080 domain-containing protein [Algoriphagus aquimaris]